MPPELIGLAANGVSGLLSMFHGFGQTHQAKNMIRNNPFPNMGTPQAILNNQKLAEQQANQGLPSEQYNLAKENIMGSQASAIKMAQDRGDALGAISSVQNNTNNALGNLAVANANARIQNRIRLMNQNNVTGGYQQQAWDWNKRQRYMQNAAAATALMGAGRQNIWGGIDKVLGGATNAASGLMGGGDGMGGGKINGNAGANGNPTYYNGNDANSGYGDFQTSY